MNALHEIDVAELEQVEGGFIPLLIGLAIMLYATDAW